MVNFIVYLKNYVNYRANVLLGHHSSFYISENRTLRSIGLRNVANKAERKNGTYIVALPLLLKNFIMVMMFVHFVDRHSLSIEFPLFIRSKVQVPEHEH